MTQINLLPWREEERKIKRILSGITLACFVCLTLVAVILFHIYLKILFNDQQVRTTYLQTQLASIQTEISGLKEKLKTQAAIRSELQLIIELRTQSFQAVRLLNALTIAVPESVVLENVSRNGKIITIEGSSESDLETTQLMKNLSGIDGFEQPVLTGISNESNTTVPERHFQMKVEFNH